ncbi:hypothetical protein CAI21_13575 [Alkalilimnicola ehrlichii]|uniref:hypothetical protein n=1 Tax=Alkalilimnicola ehrlichii TaxID=351052 RepID=UPI000E2F250C|nr:hypothetical protein [Alkalilimnicola ehrlichii]RFA27947.1 hypothetical protein CAI21_13575 [Alkalilimnicola ehrlichii]
MSVETLSDELSPFAWMSVRDGEIIKDILCGYARRAGRQLSILEWGSGLSTLSYTRILDDVGAAYRWLSLEYDRGYFEGELIAKLRERENSIMRFPASGETIEGKKGRGRPRSKRCAGTTGRSGHFWVPRMWLIAAQISMTMSIIQERCRGRSTS